MEKRCENCEYGKVVGADGEFARCDYRPTEHPLMYPVNHKCGQWTVDRKLLGTECNSALTAFLGLYISALTWKMNTYAQFADTQGRRL